MICLKNACHFSSGEGRKIAKRMIKNPGGQNEKIDIKTKRYCK